jgi:DNA invertase Pin-like site-specific DNA recombinase
LSDEELTTKTRCQKRTFLKHIDTPAKLPPKWPFFCFKTHCKINVPQLEDQDHFWYNPEQMFRLQRPSSVPKEIPMLIGYARVSTDDQNLDLQIDALNRAGCERIFSDEISGAKAHRPGLAEALDFLRPQDTLVVWRLDRLGRSLKDLVEKVELLRGRGIGFRSLHENIDTTSSAGKFQFHVFSALAEFERDLIRERTLAGLQAARARGRVGGRKREMTPEKMKMAAQLLRDGSIQVAEICKTLNVSRSTLYRYVSPDGEIRQRP